jgi:transcriptional regulator with XRE-family HTH domain
MDQTNGTSVVSAGQRLGATLRRHRAVAGLTQQALARQVGYSRSTIANAEAGDVRAGEFYRRCDATLHAGGAVTAAYLALDQAPTAPTALAAPNPSPLLGVPVEEAIEYLRAHWHLLVRTDNLLGPATALPVALDRLALLPPLLREASGPARTALLSLSARYAETTAGLYQDAGRAEEAAEWAGRALEWGHEVDDVRAIAWALYRRSELHAAEGDAPRVLSLARAALRHGGELTAPMRAALGVQQARGHALAGDERRCHERLDRAEALAAERECAGDASTGPGGFCARPWVAAQRGACALLLAAPADAVPALNAALAGMAPVYRRDRGLVLGWLAEASARLGDWDEAERLAGRSLAIGVATGSARVCRQVNEVRALVPAAR